MNEKGHFLFCLCYVITTTIEAVLWPFLISWIVRFFQKWSCFDLSLVNNWYFSFSCFYSSHYHKGRFFAYFAHFGPFCAPQVAPHHTTHPSTNPQKKRQKRCLIGKKSKDVFDLFSCSREIVFPFFLLRSWGTGPTVCSSGQNSCLNEFW